MTIKQSVSFKKQSKNNQKTIKKLSKQQKEILDEEIRKLIKDPLSGERKKGDLDFLRVHKFKVSNQEFLLGYMYTDSEFVLTLLKQGVHENFYHDIKNTI